MGDDDGPLIEVVGLRLSHDERHEWVRAHEAAPSAPSLMSVLGSCVRLVLRDLRWERREGDVGRARRGKT